MSLCVIGVTPTVTKNNNGIKSEQYSLAMDYKISLLKNKEQKKPSRTTVKAVPVKKLRYFVIHSIC